MTISERALAVVNQPPEKFKPHRIVTDEDMSKALDWLRDSARDLGAAKERLKKAEHMVKVQAAIEFKKSDAKSVEAKKADALTSDRYIEAITEDAVATGAYEMMRALREAAAMKIEAWRTEQSNIRAMKI